MVTGRARPKKERLEMAAIRGAWTFLLPGVGFAVVWAADNFTNLGIPLWVGLPIGAICYSLKKFYFPDTRF